MAKTGATALIKSLALFAEEGDRRPEPPRFVGRDASLAFLSARAEAVAQRPVAGATVLVPGIPGMGKTALLNAFADRCAAGAHTHGRRIVAIPVTVPDINVPPADAICDLAARLPLPAKTLVERLPSWAGRAKSALAKDGLLTAATLAAAAWRGKSPGELLRHELGISEASSADACLSAVSTALWPDVAVVLCLDEAQNVTQDSRAAELLQTIHQNSRKNLHVMVAAFGLPNVEDALIAAGVSRLSKESVHPLGPMPDADAKKLLRLNLDAIGMSFANPDWKAFAALAGFGKSDWERWRTDFEVRVRRSSQGFPHHLYNGLCAAAATVARRGDAFRPDDESLSAALRTFEGNRTAYYKTRLRPVARHSLALGAALTLADQDTAPVPTAWALRALCACNDRGRAVSEAEADAVLDVAVDKGILCWADEGQEKIVAPVPSMRDHLAARYATALERGTAAAVKLQDALGLGLDNPGT